MSEMDWIEHALEWGPVGLARLLEHASQPLVLIDAAGVIRFSNPAARDLLTFQSGELLGTNGFDLIHPDDRDAAAESVGTILATPGLKLAVRLRLRSHDGTWVALAVEGVNVADVDELGGVLLSLQDVSELAATEQALASSELRFRDLADRAADFIFRYRVNEPVGFEYASPAFSALTGHTAEALMADPGLFTTLVSEDDYARLLELDWTTMSHHTIEFPRVRADGARRWVQLRASVHLDGDGRAETVDGIVRDLTDMREENDELLHRALHDSLTGLPNRVLFYERLGHALRRHDRQPGSPAVLFLDLEGFKVVNDEFGHAAGDDVLVELGRRLTTEVRPGDTVARLGGDEFLVLCEGVTDDADLDALTTRIRGAVEGPMSILGRDLSVSASIGIARAEEGDDADRMVHRADLAMYRDKHRDSA